MRVLQCSMAIGMLSFLSVQASEHVNNTGSITIQNQFQEKVEINVAKIAEIQNGSYILKTEYSDIGIDLNEIHEEQDLVNVAIRIEKMQPCDKIAVTNYNGELIASDLTPGVYIVYSLENKAEGKTIPSIVSIPTWNGKKERMDYHVELFMKHIPITEDSPEIPETGDHSQVGKYVALSMISLLVVLNFLLYKKNKI